MIIKQNKILLSALVCGVLSLSQLQAGDDSMVKTIMKLRGEVEMLYAKVDDNKELYKSQMKSITAQKVDIEAQINREEIALKQAKLNLEKTKKQILEVSGTDDSLKPMVVDALKKLQATIEAGIPFKIQERVADIQKIIKDLDSGVITAEKSLALAWASHDDAIRVTKENGIFKQKIIIDGKEKLAKVAKLGSVMMYFSTSDNQVGYVRKNIDGYVYKVATSSDEQKQIASLFDAFQKQIRTGYFSLPNALITMEVK